MENTDGWRRPFFTLYIGQASSLLSSSAVQFAVIWWITVRTGSAIALTVASLVGLLPQVLIGPFAGVLVDCYDRKSVMIAADLAVAAASLALGMSFAFGAPAPKGILVIGLARELFSIDAHAIPAGRSSMQVIGVLP
jgi:DHA3 family macrolide efflux protein-like MFS transporter